MTEYQQAPRVTRQRLYIEALQDVYGRSNKVLLDAEGSGNLLYLPIDKLVGAGQRDGATSGDATLLSDPAAAEDEQRAEDEAARNRRTRQ